VKAVIAAARRLAGGDPTARTGLRPGRDELGSLVQAFDEMAGSVERLTRQNRLLLDSVGEGIVGIGEDGAVTFANPAAARALGRRAEDMLGKDAHQLFHPRRPDGTPLPHEDCRILAALRDHAPHSGPGEVFWRRDGSSMAVDFVSTPLVDAGRVVGAVLVFRDVSERRALEDRLRHAEKMEAVGQLAGGVAHDFNNLLTAIVSYAALVRDALPSSHPSVSDVREIEAAAERAAGLTRQLLAFSRRQRVAPRVVELRRVVSGMERMLRRVLPENVALSVAVHAPGTVFADPAQLELAILNLAVNARDAVTSGGRIDIRVFEIEEGASDLGDGERPSGPLAILEVRDDGMGMDAATRERIFEPFFTTKPAGKGTGLGLATVYGIVSQSGGEIRVRSEPGRGSAFRVYLPRWSGAAAEAGAGTAPRPSRGAETVLVVEDDAPIRALVVRSLAAAGYRVLDAGSGDEALATARTAAVPDLLVTDVILPGRNGWELAEELAARRPGLRVLFMSGYAAQHSGEPLLPFEAPLLEKPFAPDELLRRVREVLDAPPAGARDGSAPLRAG
jgi:PAS domain S-box-containing protein